jgi:hypothetical protein
MITPVRRRLPLPASLVLVLAFGCGTAPDADRAAAGEPEHDMAAMPYEGEQADLAELRRVTAGFDDIAAARAAGYTEQITSCWYHRERGGQGYHFGRPDLIDGEVALQEPELLMYEPRPDGSFEFLGVEYIVPVSAWDRPEPPALLGRQFMRNDRLGLHVLHVWLGRDNPSGLYADWNPAVSCDHAAESEDRA